MTPSLLICGGDRTPGVAHADRDVLVLHAVRRRPMKRSLAGCSQSQSLIAQDCRRLPARHPVTFKEIDSPAV